MTDDESFLRTILASPNDQFARLVYADWLDDRGDPRATYLRLGARVAELPFGHTDRPALRRQMLETQAELPSWWVAIVGGLRATESTPDPVRIEDAARVLDRPAKYTDADGYEMSITAAALSGFTRAVAYLEERSKWRENYQDIHYYLRLRDRTGAEVTCEPKTYNPYFGCAVQFLEWYGAGVLMVYEEKHATYACRFSPNGLPWYHKVEYKWVLDDRVLAFRQYGETDVQCLSVPDLELLPALSEAEARERELLPAK